MLHKVKYAGLVEYDVAFCEWSGNISRSERIVFAAKGAKHHAESFGDKCIELVSIDDKILTEDERRIARAAWRFDWFSNAYETPTAV